MEPVLRRMRADDLPAAVELDAASLSRSWREKVWRRELQSSLSTYLVVEERGEIAAQVGVKNISGELHIMTLAVRTERRRRGYARRLVEAALAAHPDASLAFLEVRPSNVAARSLYESLGFTVTSRRPRYYGDEDALLMALDLRSSQRSGAAPGARGSCGSLEDARKA